MGSQGDAEYIAPNPAFGATFTYFMANKVKSLKGDRKAREKTNTDFPGWDALETENNQDGPHILLIVKDASGNVVNTVRGTNRKGFNRVSWGLNHPNKNGERLNGRGDGIGGGFIMATPGTYSVTLVKRVDGVTTTLQEPKEFKVVPMYDGHLPRKSFDEFNQFREDAFSFQQDLTATNLMMTNSIQRIAAMKRAANKTTAPNDALLKQINDVRLSLLAVQKELRGHPVKGEIGERSNPTPNDGNRMVFNGLSNTYGPTGNQKASFNRAKKQLQGVKAKLQSIVNTLPAIERSLKAAGAPWIEGQN